MKKRQKRKRGTLISSFRSALGRIGRGNGLFFSSCRYDGVASPDFKYEPEQEERLLSNLDTKGRMELLIRFLGIISMLRLVWFNSRRQDSEERRNLGGIKTYRKRNLLKWNWNCD